METKAKRFILVLDDVEPEANAMLQALYSRDPQSVTVHLERVRTVGPAKFMSSYYVGYGHKSIGDCGTTTLFIEQVSLLAAKAIQDWPLYNGQEASTRYLNMAKQAVLNPAGTAEGEEIQRRWMKLYEDLIVQLVPYIKEHTPCAEGASEKTYDKAVHARAFDIARGFLPAGVTTLLAWHSNLRQAHDHLKRLRHHPLAEVREIAIECVQTLRERYPNSFSHKEYPSEEKFLNEISPHAYAMTSGIEEFAGRSYLRSEMLAPFASAMKSRPEKAELPHEMRVAGDIEFRFLLDFGSYRDLQRHRSIVLPQPLLTMSYGFENWYLAQLPEAARESAERVLLDQMTAIERLELTDEDAQYYIPLGYRVGCVMTSGLPAAVYLSELRSAQTVHATFRKVAQQMGCFLKEQFPELALYIDFGEDAFSFKRGTQDICKREAA